MKIFKVLLIAASVALMPDHAFAGQSFSFDGEIDFLANEFNIVIDLDEKSSFAAKVTRASGTNYRFSLDLDHLKTPLFDLTSKIESSVDLVKRERNGDEDGGAAFQGKVWSQYSLVNYKPINELSGRFEVKDKRLYIMALSVGKLTCEGFLDLDSPYALEATVRLFGVDMNDFLNFWDPGNEYDSAGEVLGEIKASGSLESLALKGSLESTNGFVKHLNYDSIVLNLEGIFPRMIIANSTITQSDGVSFSLDGTFDLSDKENFNKQIKALTLAPLVNETGSEMEWTIKRINPEASSTTELKYQFKKGDRLGVGPGADDEIDMLGIERTKKF